jgi:hypothetical protein
MLFEIFVEHSAVPKYFHKLLQKPEIFVPARWTLIWEEPKAVGSKYSE